MSTAAIACIGSALLVIGLILMAFGIVLGADPEGRATGEAFALFCLGMACEACAAGFAVYALIRLGLGS